MWRNAFYNFLCIFRSVKKLKANPRRFLTQWIKSGRMRVISSELHQHPSLVPRKRNQAKLKTIIKPVIIARENFVTMPLTDMWSFVKRRAPELPRHQSRMSWPKQNSWQGWNIIPRKLNQVGFTEEKVYCPIETWWFYSLRAVCRLTLITYLEILL